MSANHAPAGPIRLLIKSWSPTTLNAGSPGLYESNASSKIRLKPATDGRPDRIFERDGRFNPREKWLMGAMSTGPVIGGADWTCRLPDHWLFAGTGMREGDSIKNLVGWEYHGDPAPIAGLEVVASGPTQRAPGEPNGGTYTATIYPGPKGNFVFNAATIFWAQGMGVPPGHMLPWSHGSRPHGADPRVQQITRNLLKRAGCLPDGQMGG